MSTASSTHQLPSTRSSSHDYLMKNKDNRYVLFPLKLYAILVNEIPSIISWVPGGQSFRIHDIKLFAAEITPKYFKCKL